MGKNEFREALQVLEGLGYTLNNKFQQHETAFQNIPMIFNCNKWPQFTSAEDELVFNSRVQFMELTQSFPTLNQAYP